MARGPAKGSGKTGGADVGKLGGRPSRQLKLRHGEEVSIIVADEAGAWSPLGTATIEIVKGAAVLKLPDGRSLRLINVE